MGEQEKPKFSEVVRYFLIRLNLTHLSINCLDVESSLGNAQTLSCCRVIGKGIRSWVQDEWLDILRQALAHDWDGTTTFKREPPSTAHGRLIEQKELEILQKKMYFFKKRFKVFEQKVAHSESSRA